MRRWLVPLVAGWVLLGGLVGCSRPSGPEAPNGTPLPTPTALESIPQLGGSEELPPLEPRPTGTTISTGNETVFGAALAVTVESVTAVTGTPGHPKEVGGPGVAFRLLLRNVSDQPVSAGDLLMQVSDATGESCAEATGAPAVFPVARLNPGQSALLIRVFLMPQDARSQIKASIIWGQDTPVVLFEGGIN